MHPLIGYLADVCAFVAGCMLMVFDLLQMIQLRLEFTRFEWLIWTGGRRVSLPTLCNLPVTPFYGGLKLKTTNTGKNRVHYDDRYQWGSWNKKNKGISALVWNFFYFGGEIQCYVENRQVQGSKKRIFVTLYSMYIKFRIRNQFPWSRAFQLLPWRG
jgi:hypothetical protein